MKDIILKPQEEKQFILDDGMDFAVRGAPCYVIKVAPREYLVRNLDPKKILTVYFVPKQG